MKRDGWETIAGLILLAALYGLVTLAIIVSAVGVENIFQEVLIRVAIAPFLLGLLLLIFGVLDIRLGSEMYPQPAGWPGVGRHLVDPRRPWVVVALMSGGDVNRMREFYFNIGYKKAMEGSCPHCYKRLDPEWQPTT